MDSIVCIFNCECYTGSRLFHQIHAPHVFHTFNNNQTSLLSIYQVGGGFYKRDRPLQYQSEVKQLMKSSPTFGSDEKFYQCKMKDEYDRGFMLFKDPEKMMQTVKPQRQNNVFDC